MKLLILALLLPILLVAMFAGVAPVFVPNVLISGEPGSGKSVGTAHLALAQLRRQTPARNHLARLEPLAAAHADDVDAQLHLHLAIAKELEDLGDAPRAFDHYVRGKGAVRARRVCR